MDIPHSIYSKDDTPGCTMQANEFTGMDDSFSRDEFLSHAEFSEKQEDGDTSRFLRDRQTRQIAPCSVRRLRTLPCR